MPKFQTGSSLIKQKMQGGGTGTRTQRATDFTPFFSLKDGEEAFVQFFTDIEDVVLATIHRFVKVSIERNGEIVKGYRDFACRKMDAWEDGDGSCILCDELGHVPKDNFAAVAVLLDPVYDPSATTKRISDIQSFTIRGNEYKTKDGTEIFYPEYNIVFQAAQNFWHQFTSHNDQIGPITANPWKIIREGNDQSTTYQAYEVDKAELVDFRNVTVPSIQEILENLGSKERYDTYFGDKSLWETQFQKYVTKEEGAGNSGPVRKTEDSEAEEDAESAFERIKRQTAAMSNKK
jgi:hypothetical protein